jgi:hypothetical protein
VRIYKGARGWRTTVFVMPDSENVEQIKHEAKIARRNIKRDAADSAERRHARDDKD